MPLLELPRKSLVILLSLLSIAHSMPSSFGQNRPDAVVRGLGIPISNPDVNPDEMIPNRYIVVYDKNATESAIDAHQSSVLSEIKKRGLTRRSSDGRPLSPMVHSMHLSGWRAMCLEAEDAMIINIESASEVAYVEADTRMSTQELVVQDDAPLGLVRISHANKNSNDDYAYDASGTGEGVVVYVVDTGIMTSHEEFGKKTSMAANFVNDINTDENGHGSHVAAIIGGASFGVVKQAEIVGVKVLDSKGQGSNALVLQGIQYVAADVAKRGLAGKAVVNVSIGGAKSQALNSAIEAITRDGVVVVVAAGNSNKDSDQFSPASARSAITVGAIDAANDRRANFSNFGPAVDIFAPGVKVKSAGIADNRATKVLSGTSMASPHIAGLAAYMISTDPSLDEPSKVIRRIIQLARSTNSRVAQPKDGTVQLIAYNGSGE